jgi:hypothetical protein
MNVKNTLELKIHVYGLSINDYLLSFFIPLLSVNASIAAV